MVQFNRLRLTGFKSFVDPTELVIEKGITGIVGPNGCGKSNLVEALRWVMGETSAKRMRGSGMEDVIFGGTANRPARNIAEVSLFLGNDDRKAPSQFNDEDVLEVLRRIEREKGSTYRVNSKEVRARDVQLLFADSATGANSTAIVSQGKIGALINAKPRDRRSLLEEAAGIGGLHSRRHEAELRLRAAETNLERLDDVIGTLESQLAGLKKQARQASRYRNIAGHLRRNEALLAHIDKEAAEARRAKAKEALGLAEQAVAELTERAAAASTHQMELSSALPELRKLEAAAAATLQRLVVERDALEREERQIAEARANAVQRQEQLASDLARAGRQGQDAAEASERLTAERGEIEAARAGASEALEAAEATRKEAAELTEARQAETDKATEQLAADEASARALERRRQELTQRLEQLKTRLAHIEHERETLLAQSGRTEELQAAEATTKAAAEAAENARSQADAAEATQATARIRESETREAWQAAREAHAKVEAEIAALSALVEPQDEEMWPAVVDAVTVTPGHEQALGAALGDDLSASTDEAAPAHWESLPALGIARSLPEGVRPLSQVVSGPAALDRRLSQVGLVEDAAQGARLQPQLKPGQRLVTKAGDLWRWDGYIAKADAPTAAAQRLAQKNRLAELRAGLDELLDAVARCEEAHLNAKAAAEAAAIAERNTREALRQAFAALDRARDAEAKLQRELTATSNRQAALEEAVASVKANLAETQDALEQVSADQAALPDIEAERQALGGLRAALTEARAALSEAQGQVHRLEREEEARGQRLMSIAGELASWSRRAEEAAKHAEELSERQEAVTAEIAELDEKPKAIAEAREALAEKIEAAETHRKTEADKLAEGETALATADKALKAVESDLSTAREERVRCQAAVEQAEEAHSALAERVREKLDCALEDLLEIAEHDAEKGLPPRQELEGKIERLKRERENLGQVNLRAEAEAEELTEQIAGMQHEREDLISAIARLRQGISSLNREGRERLLAAFEQVDKHFSELFVRLFGGGRAHLKLTESEDPLEAGLEIMASPPGKRLQVMSLLSGGEQALTAIALLFAVFLTNPAPICVLDEVDAPLDDSNVDRFCSLVEEIAHSLDTRFLMITHHRLTMARVDRLYGVTMSERGVSQLVSVDLEAAEALRETA